MKRKAKLNGILFVAITVVAVTTLIAFWSICNQKFFSMITERVVDDYSETAMAVQKNVETLISYTEDFSKHISLDGRVQALIKEQTDPGDGGSIRNELAIRNGWEDISVRLIYSSSQLAGFGAYAQGQLLYGYYNFSIDFDQNAIDKKYLALAEQQKSPVWTNLMTLRSTGGWYHKQEQVFAVLKYVQDDVGECLGCVALFVREASFSEILAGMDEAKDRAFYLVDEAGRIASSENETDLYRPAAQVLNLTGEEYLTCLEQEQLLLETAGEAPVLYMARKIEGTQFRLVGRAVLNELQVQRTEFATFMQIALLVSLTVAVLASWFVSRQVTRPIKQIVAIMKRIEDGNNAEKLRCPEGGIEEISLLGEEFNRLMDKVDASADQIYQEQRQRRHNEVRLLQAQIVPHFLYNTLGMICAFIKLNRQKDALDAIQNLANFYRMSLSGGNERITLREEMELTRNYLALQRMRYIEYVDYTMIHDEKASNYIIPKLLIQPLVENVLNHGLKADGEKCIIIIETQYDEEKDCCNILVSDTGQGIKAERLAEIRESLRKETSLTKSFGLLNVYQRMKMLYGDRFTMDVDSVEGKYTTFILSIQGKADKTLARNDHV